MGATRSLVGLLSGAASFAWLIFVLNPIQVASLLVRPFSKPAFRSINRWCAASIWGWWALMAEHQNGIEVRFFGDPIPTGENALILPNHQTIADVMVVICFARRIGRQGDLKWFVKDPVKWVPGPGWGMKLLDCIYVKRDWSRDEAEIQRLFGRFKEENIPISLVSFLEGTRFTASKHAEALRFARERRLEEPQHTLIPRTKGFVATMNGLGPHLDAIHDLTIAYPGRVPTMLDCFLARVPRVDVYFRRFSVSGLPDGGDALEQWAQERFQEKDQLLADYRETEGFPARTALAEGMDDPCPTC